MTALGATVRAVPAAAVVTGEIRARDVGTEKNTAIGFTGRGSSEASPSGLFRPAPVASLVSGQLTCFAVANRTPTLSLAVGTPVETVSTAVPSADNPAILARWLANGNGLWFGTIAVESNPEVGQDDNIGH